MNTKFSIILRILGQRSFRRKDYMCSVQRVDARMWMTHASQLLKLNLVGAGPDRQRGLATCAWPNPPSCARFEVHQSSGGIFISQRKFTTDILKKFGMIDCKVVATLMNMNEKLQVEDGTGKGDASHYRSLVEGLIYLTHTRLDIAFPIGVVSRFMQSPTKHHFEVAKRILRYIAGTMEYGIWYSQKSECKLFGYTDNDWAGCLDDRKSTSRNVFSLGSGAISWSLKSIVNFICMIVTQLILPFQKARF
ncbi:hypothetical protein GH714_011372 [Hevea brasiliensis]|uniref:Reverse transcriptase Ty1/copia-type domain-containing protein n=1 Tax=Hevea brasiliensis TaxID=3981 RepID=A0A6A6KLC5_HEVBR|nr:hypothetical protein GH714_011372 [Hevea brasiliensis]